MKKYLALLLAVILAVNVSATDGLVEVLEPDRQSTQVTHHVEARYTVSIPASVQCDGTVYYFTAPEMELCPNDIVFVRIWGLNDNSGHITLSTADGSRSIVAQVYGTINSMPFANGDIAGTFTDGKLQTDIGFYVIPEENGAKPGDYFGSIQFDINYQRGSV